MGEKKKKKQTCVKKTEKSSPQVIYLILIDLRVFSWLGYNLSKLSFKPNWPNSFFPQPKTAPKTKIIH